MRLFYKLHAVINKQKASAVKTGTIFATNNVDPVSRGRGLIHVGLI